MSERRLLLDTHYWAWYVEGKESRFSSRSLRAVRQAIHNNTLLVSVISVWEIGMLESKGRIRLGVPVEDWIRGALDMPGLMMVPLSPEIALSSSRLLGFSLAIHPIASSPPPHGIRRLDS